MNENMSRTAIAATTRQEPEKPTINITDSTGVVVNAPANNPYQIVCGDCLSLMSRMAAASVDICVTSPPYNLRNSSGGGMKSDNKHSKWPSAELSRGYANHSDCMPHKEYVAWQRECLAEMMRVTKVNGAIFYNHKWRVQNGLLQERADIVRGFPVRQIIIWQRRGGINFNAGYFLPTYEVIYLIAKPGFRLAARANAIGDVWNIPQERNNPHPAPFPVALAERMIASTNARIVLDPFIGSGTTAEAALRLNRGFIGFDNSADYCRMARERAEAVSSELFRRRTPRPAMLRARRSWASDKMASRRFWPPSREGSAMSSRSSSPSDGVAATVPAASRRGEAAWPFSRPTPTRRTPPQKFISTKESKDDKQPQE